MDPEATTGDSGPRCLAWAIGALIVACFCGAVLWGIEWGVPSAERAQLDGAAGRAKSLSPEMVEESWRIWGSRGRRSEVAEQFPRHLFNPLRSYHPDEYQVFKSLSNMRPGKLDLDPKNYIYPSLHTYLTGAALGACSLVGVVHLERSLAYYFDHPDELGRMYLVGRVLSLLAALGAMLLVWRVGERLGRGTGLLALALLAVMPALCIHAHNLTRDTLTALAAIALFACCVKLAKTGTAKWFDLAGAAAGLCVALQYFAAVLWVLIPLAALLWYRKEGETKRAMVGGLITSLIVMAAVFALTSPYHLLRADRFLADFQSETTHVGGGVFARLGTLTWLTHLPGMLPALVTWPVAVVVALGLVWCFARREPSDWLLLAWVAVWAGVVGFDGRSYSRYYVGLLPALALIGARGLLGMRALLERAVKLPWAAQAASAAALIAVLCPAGAMTLAWAELYATDNVRTAAGRWVAKNVPAGARVGATEWPWQYEMPPLDPARFRLVVMEDSPRKLPFDTQRLWQEKPDYFVTSSLQFGRIPGRSKPLDAKAYFWQYLFRGGLYRIARQFDVPHRFLGADLLALPEDMRYVNPVIYLLERKTVQASRPRTGAGT